MGPPRMRERPGWYADALAQRPRHDEVSADGVTVHVRSWGDPALPPLVLVHGGAAHSAWWDHIGPLLSSRHPVLAPDLSGHGDSGWRTPYRVARWSSELAAVVRALTDAPPVVVGHSMGGHVGLRLALDAAVPLRGLVMVDSLFPAAGTRAPREATGPRRLYPSREAILARFRTLPADTPKEAHVVEHVAAESVVAVGAGWSWKFDPAFFTHDLLALEDVRALDVPALVVRGEHGMVDEPTARAVAEALGQPGAVAMIRDSGHHVPLDQPLALVDLVEETAARWSPATSPSATAR